MVRRHLGYRCWYLEVGTSGSLSSASSAFMLWLWKLLRGNSKQVPKNAFSALWVYIDITVEKRPIGQGSTWAVERYMVVGWGIKWSFPLDSL